MSCPFCENPKKSKWYYDGDFFVVADDAGKKDTLILFPHKHWTQEFLKSFKDEVERLIKGIARAKWEREIKFSIDWVNRTYKHAHIQLKKVN